MSKSLLLGAVASLSLGLFACGGATRDEVSTGSPPAGSATTAPSGSATPPPVGTSPPVTVHPTAGPGVVIPQDGTVVFKSKGGFAANGADTKICTVVDEAYTYEVATHQLSWKRCAMDPAGTTNDYVVGARALASGESAKLDAALGALQVVKALSTCGADKPAETLEVSSPSALTPEIFNDTFYHCSDDGLVHVSGLDDVYSAMYALTH